MQNEIQIHESGGIFTGNFTADHIEEVRSVAEVGVSIYRLGHYACDGGPQRSSVPEMSDERLCATRFRGTVRRFTIKCGQRRYRGSIRPDGPS